MGTTSSPMACSPQGPSPSRLPASQSPSLAQGQSPYRVNSSQHGSMPRSPAARSLGASMMMAAHDQGVRAIQPRQGSEGREGLFSDGSPSPHGRMRETITSSGTQSIPSAVMSLRNKANLIGPAPLPSPQLMRTAYASRAAATLTCRGGHASWRLAWGRHAGAE
jgi:hypothetical protein